MGHKTHPIGFRLGGVQHWKTRWFASNGQVYAGKVKEDMAIRNFIRARYRDTGGLTDIDIEHENKDLKILISTTRPGTIIGRQGTRIDTLKKDLAAKTSYEIRVNVVEVKQPEMSAAHAAQSIVEQVEARAPFRRAVRNAITRTMQSGAKGIKVAIKGRLGGAEIAREYKERQGRVPLHTLKSKIDFAVREAHTTYGVIGVKVWIYSGDADPRALPITVGGSPVGKGLT